MLLLFCVFKFVISLSLIIDFQYCCRHIAAHPFRPPDRSFSVVFCLLNFIDSIIKPPVWCLHKPAYSAILPPANFSITWISKSTTLKLWKNGIITTILRPMCSYHYHSFICGCSCACAVASVSSSSLLYWSWSFHHMTLSLSSLFPSFIDNNKLCVRLPKKNHFKSWTFFLLFDIQ